ncbi:MAG TPA: CopG family transcriptional regulator [Actinomycetota bacterium]
MKKTSVYLSDEETDRLERIARKEGISQAQVIRNAIRGYVPRTEGPRDFAMARSGRGPGTSVADLPEEELLAGFGE